MRVQDLLHIRWAISWAASGSSLILVIRPKTVVNSLETVDSLAIRFVAPLQIANGHRWVCNCYRWRIVAKWGRISAAPVRSMITDCVAKLCRWGMTEYAVVYCAETRNNWPEQFGLVEWQLVRWDAVLVIGRCDGVSKAEKNGIVVYRW